MKKSLYKGLLIGLFSFISACSESDGGGGNGTVAAVPGPQGVVDADGNTSVYCQFGQGTYACYQKNPQTGQELCHTEIRRYADIPTMCQQVQLQTQTQSYQCDVRGALNRIYRENCQNVALPGQSGVPTQPGIPTQPINPVNADQKTIMCTYSGYNNGYIVVPVQLPIQVDAKAEMEISFNNKYFFIDIGRFGTTRMLYTPGNRGVSDTITLSNKGLDSTLSFSQSGFAGQPVRIEAQDDSGRTKLTLSCEGKSKFKKNIINAKYTQFVCVGSASLRKARGVTEDIQFTAPYDSRLIDSEIQLAKGLTAKISGDGENADNARIEYRARGLTLDHSANSTAYLKTKSTFKARSAGRFVDVTCTPQ
ncbi:MAG: hypothetical protein H7328_00415 [Bdellovibrio sp.]|nr:hypothetical protein [Bdellovibrio sp.]